MRRLVDQLHEIALRKERLIAHAGAQRAAVGAGFRQLQGPIGAVDRGLEIAHFLRRHPVLVAVAVASMVALRRRSLVPLAGSVLSAWRLWRSLSAWAA